MIFSYILSGFLLTILAVDWIFLPRSARKSRNVLIAVLAMGAIFALKPGAFKSIAATAGVSDPFDLVFLPVLAILVREFFVSRLRYVQQEQRYTELIRSLALRDARQVAVAPSLRNPKTGSAE